LSEIERQHVHVDVAAAEQKVGAADEGCGDDAEGDEIGLPDRVLVEHVTDEHHLADDHHAGGDQPRGENAADLRDQRDAADERVHVCPLRPAHTTTGGTARRSLAIRCGVT
jgi:hypothetical protein